MSIPAAFLDQLRERTSLSGLIQKSVPLKRKGKEHSACCPFHQEKSPSFYVNDEKGFYHCFGCSAHGDAIRWMTDHQGMSFIDAVKDLAAAAGMEVPAADPRQLERDRARNGHLDVMERVADRFTRHDSSGPIAKRAMEYLESRGITPREAMKFGIGFAPKVRMGEKPFAAECGDVEQLITLGVMGRSETGRLYDFFRDRITIPIHDARGRVVGFGARALGDEKPKYLNSPDTPIFDKGRSLFNLHRAAPAARAKDRLIIVEGYMDVIGMASAGIDECVAPNGTALTEHQMALAWKLVDRPLVCLDGDAAGRKAAIRAALKALPLLVPGKGLDFVFPPDGQDPDDIARKGGAEAVSAMISEPLGILDVIWRDALTRLREASGAPEQTSKVKRDLRDLLATIKDGDVRADYATAVQQRMAAYNERASRTAKRSAPGRQGVRDAMQDALAKGILRHVGHTAALNEMIARIVWAKPDVARVIDLVLWHEGLSESNLMEVLESRNLGGDYRAIMARDTLRFPFLPRQVGPASLEALSAALAAETAK